METNDTIIVNEILSILKHSSWNQQIALDRRDISFYIKQIMDRFSEVNTEAYKAAEDQINELEFEIKELTSEIESLKEKNAVLSQKILLIKSNEL